MRNFKKLLVFASLLLVGFNSFAQNFTNRGKEFWVGYGHHQYMEYVGDNSQEMVLYFYSGDNDATVTVKLEGSGTPLPPPAGGPWTRTYFIPKNTVISIEDPLPAGVTVTKSPTCIPAISPIPKGLAGRDCGFDARLWTCAPPTCSGGEGVFKNRGIHITSTAPIVAYAHIYGGVSSGATMLMPVETWGYNYTSINSEQQNADNAYSWMYIVSQHDNTWVHITPSVPTRNGRPAGVTFDTVLNRGEIYQVIGKLTSTTGGFNLTGTKVQSFDGGTGVCYPIAVYAGSSRTGGEDPCAGGGRDNDMQQMFPEQAWGKRYLTAPFSNSNSPSSLMECVYKIAVIDPTTVVKKNGTVLTGLIGGKYYKFSSTTPDFIEADKPIMVAQFMGGGCVSNDGDPEMVYLSPIEQAINDVGFYRNTKEAINTQYLTLIIPNNGVNSLKIDGTLFSAIPAAQKHSYAHPNLAGYTVCIKRWNPSTKGASTARSDSAFTGITYGEGGAESYGYNAGTYVNNLNALTFIKNDLDTAKQSKFTCTDTKVNICALVAYKPTQIIWRFSQVKHITPNTGDDTTGDGVTVMVATDSVVVDGKTYYRYCAPANPYVFDSLGNHVIPFEVKNPAASVCNPWEKFELKIDVRQKPVADFTAVLPSCPTDSVKFIGAGSGGGYTIRGWFWEFPQGTPSADSSQNTGYIFPGPGTYNVKLTVASLEGCTDDTVKTVTIAPSSTTSFTVNPTALCEGGPVTITPGPTTTTEWYWDFGDGIKDTTYNGNPFTHTYLGYGTFTISHSIKSSGTCNVSALPQTVTVHANPFATFNINPPGCLPANGVVQFTSTATAPDGQTIATHAWDFGDPNATTGNPNTSSAPAPSHQYTGVGTYTIQYSVTTSNNCRKDTTVVAVFNVTPAVSYPVLADVCLSSPPSNINSGIVTNGVPVTEYYSGPGIINAATGLFDPAVAGVGTHVIWYHATSTAGGCTDSVSQTITVNTVTNLGFTFPTGCLPNGTVQFTNNNTAGTFSWDFDDPASGVNNTSTLTNPQHTYTGSGPYNVKLRVTGATCIKDTIIAVTVKIQPQLSFGALSGVCANVAPFTITPPATVTNGVAGTGVYSGTGITNGATGTFDPSVANAGPNPIKYVFTSSLGCMDSISSSITVNPVPQAGFSFPVNCLPNYNVAFTDTSKFPAGSTGTPTYSWDFGEPSSGVNNTSAAQNPGHTYSSSGPFNVTLIVVSSGCSDTAITPVTVRVQPQLSFTPLTGVCANEPPFAITSATVTNGVTGSGVYSGPGITNGAAGTFDASIAGIGTHTIKYIFTSTLGCIDSIQGNITVKGVPDAGFTFPTTCLANGTVQFTDTSKIPAGSVGSTTYTWNFGEPSSGANNVSNATNPTHSYSSSGPFNVQLVVNANGCSDSTTVSVTVRIQPQLNFPAQAAVCGNLAPFILNPPPVVTNGVAGSGVYSGPGITNANTGMFDPSIAGVGTHTIKWVFTSSLGCIDSTQTTIVVKGVPDAGFTFPTTCLANGTVQFTDTSKIPAGSGTPSYTWNFGEPSSGANNVSSLQNPTHSYSSSGPFNVKLVVNANGCSDSTTVPVTVRIQPQLNFPAQAAVCGNLAPFILNPPPVVTNGVAGSGVYSGPGITNANTGMFDPSIAGVGTHTIKWVFTSSLGCIDSTQTTITVKGIPDAGFKFPTACLPNSTVQFTDTSKIPAGSGTPSYTWNFGEPSSGASNVSSLQNPTHSYGSPGPFSVKIVVTANGCSDSATAPVTVRVTPKLSFGTLNSVCANVPPFAISPAPTVTNGVAGNGVYSGPGITNGTTGMFDPSIAGVGTHTIKYVFTSLLGCADSITSQITVKQVPVASFTYPTGCLTSNTVQFNSTAVPGGSYSWNFGDPASGANNTSGQANPTHTYNIFGTYTINMSVTLNGCTDDTTVTTIFKLQPVISFPRLASVCLMNDTISIDKAAILNGVPGPKGKYSGPGVFDTSGQFNPILAGEGVHTITYTFTSDAGCVATKTSTIRVWPRPIVTNISFVNTPDSNICINKPLALSGQVLISSGKVVTWNWNLGDGTDTVFNSGAQFNYSYDSANSYVIKLVAISDSGCASVEKSRIINIRALPAVSFISPTGVCMPNASVQFDNTTTIPHENVNTLAFEWNFGDNTSHSTLSDPVHVYNTTLSQADVILNATSAYGCKAADTATILFYPKPVADFTANPTEICQGKSVTLTNTTTSPNIASATWDYGDGSASSNAISPVITYQGIGEYQPSLVVVSANGCRDTASKKVRVHLQPIADAGKSFTVNAGTQVTFQGRVNGPNLTYTWAPSTGLNNASILNPTLRAIANQTYTFTVVGDGGCTDSDTMNVSILYPLRIPNAFSPNGDGVNDVWDISNLKDYPISYVEVFNRYGQSVFLANGKYTKSWNGTFNGKALPAGTYYYIIDLKNGTKPVSGYVAIIK